MPHLQHQVDMLDFHDLLALGVVGALIEALKLCHLSVSIGDSDAAHGSRAALASPHDSFVGTAATARAPPLGPPPRKN